MKLFIISAQVVLVSYTVLILYPLLNMFFSAFKTTIEIYRHPYTLPKVWYLDKFYDVWVIKGFSLYFFNSIVVTAVSMAFVLLLGSMAAFGIARYNYKLKTAVSMIFLGGIMLPLKAAVIPLFLLIRGLNLLDNPVALIIIYTAMGLPSTIFILSGFMKSIPGELEYAGRVDGCNDWQIYALLVMPLTVPSLVLVTIYNAVPIWNDFFFPLVFIQTPSLKTLPLGLTTFFGQYETEWGLLFTGLTIAIIPMLLLYLFLSRYFIKGMTAGAIK